jgi:deoxyribonuclease-4
MKFGAHLSSSGGISEIPQRAKLIEAECFQFFSRPPQGGPAPKLNPETIEKFKKDLKKLKINEYFIHAPYFINLASANNRIFYGSIKVLKEELERANQLEAKGVIFHIGSAKDLGLEKALEKSIRGINEILKDYTKKALLIIENSAGAGEIIGDTLEEIGKIFKKIENNHKGICLDTAHAFESGYDLRNSSGIKKTLADFEKHIGLENLTVIHTNDSASDLNSHKDRHIGIGAGFLKKEAFKLLLNEKKLQNLCFILETPKKTYKDDLQNLEILKSLVKKA